jgi:glycosyltransferase involved in cell wall biosynthesis
VGEVEEKSQNRPKVSIGVPVYNGESFLPQALNSILGQTFQDFELIVSDNASDDGTEEICRAYAARDDRIRYVRNEANLGAAKNFNQLVTWAKGEYFKWAAHDDSIAPGFLERCVEVLDQDPSVVLCSARTRAVDEHGATVKEFEPRDFGAAEPHKRFCELVTTRHGHNAVFGLIRLSALRKTQLIGAFSSSDRSLLAELILLGRFHEIPEYWFYKRHHPGQHWRVYSTYQAREAWYDPARVGKRTYRTWRILQEYLRAIGRASLTSRERVLCYRCLLPWIRRNWRRLYRDLAPG